MERRQREETVEGSRSQQSTLTGILALKNFTIPRKKRTSGEGFTRFSQNPHWQKKICDGMQTV